MKRNWHFNKNQSFIKKCLKLLVSINTCLNITVIVIWAKIVKYKELKWSILARALKNMFSSKIFKISSALEICASKCSTL